jgi:hypothetical protein
MLQALPVELAIAQEVLFSQHSLAIDDDVRRNRLSGASKHSALKKRSAPAMPSFTRAGLIAWHMQEALRPRGGAEMLPGAWAFERIVDAILIAAILAGVGFFIAWFFWPI